MSLSMSASTCSKGLQLGARRCMTPGLTTLLLLLELLMWYSC